MAVDEDVGSDLEALTDRALGGESAPVDLG